MTEEKKKSLHQTCETLLRTYQLLARREGISFVPSERNILALDSIVKTVHASYFGFKRYPSPAQKSAAYFYYIIKNHPMTDGNKRLAVLWFELTTLTDEYHPILLHDQESGRPITLDELAIAVERSREPHEVAISRLASLFSTITYLALPE